MVVLNRLFMMVICMVFVSTMTVSASEKKTKMIKYKGSGEEKGIGSYDDSSKDASGIVGYRGGSDNKIDEDLKIKDSGAMLEETMKHSDAVTRDVSEKMDKILSKNIENIIEDTVKLSVLTGSVFMKGTGVDPAIMGEIMLHDMPGGVMVEGNIRNVTKAGLHGFHIHQNPSCDENGKAAGGHYNPDSVDHGFLLKDGHENAHAGDLGNVEIDEAGNGRYNAFIPGLSLKDGPYSIANRAVILHEQEDDGGQPTGNAGARIACGVIIVK